MRLLIQRVTQAAVVVAGTEVARIERGLLVFVSFGLGDGADRLPRMADKLVHLRIFEDPAGKMNRSVGDLEGRILLVSQFTLHASTRRGHRPSFDAALPPDEALRLFDLFAKEVMDRGIPVSTGVFGAHMSVALVNDGPVTIWMEDEG